MIRTLDITDRETARQVLELQLISYRVEAELTGFDGIPPLKDTVEMLQGCGETFMGFFREEALAGTVSYLLEGKVLDIHRVMVHPRHQGKGYGRDLLTAAEQAARTFDGIEAVRLTCRGGLGLERFYGSCGYKEVGRIPGAIRVEPGDDRDDVIMLLPLG